MFANSRDFREKSEGCQVTGAGPKRRLLIFRERIADFSVDGGIPSLAAAPGSPETRRLHWRERRTGAVSE